MVLNPKNYLSERIWKHEKSNADYTAYWIRYKPNRVLRKRFEMLPALTTIGFTVSAIAYLAWLALHGINPSTTIFLVAWVVALVAVVVFNPLTIVQLLQPTHIELNESGIRYHWLRLLFSARTPLIPWDRVSHVTTNSKTIMKQDEVVLEFNVIARGSTFLERLHYFLLGPALAWGWLTSDRAQIHFNIDGIASSDDRTRLQLGLKKFLPSYRIEPKVADELNMYMKFDSYTSIWLDQLETGKRQRGTALETDAMLSNNTYKIVKNIGSGGQAQVYLAQMLKTLADLSDAPGVARGETIVDMSDLPIAEFAPEEGDVQPSSVVLKEFVLPTQAGKNIRKRVLQNIQREAMLWRKLRHPNIARMIDFFVEDQRAYLVLEHIEGTTLKDLVTTGGAMTERQVVELSIQLCDILGYMHRRQPPILHRDFTPDNLMIDSKGTVKLIDFNVAQQLEAQTTKTVVGKHAYIPPEQFRGKADTRSDIYACGATLYFLLSGSEPEPISEAHPQKVVPQLSSEIDRIVAKATSTGLSTRYQSCQELKTDLLALLPAEIGLPNHAESNED